MKVVLLPEEAPKFQDPLQEIRDELNANMPPSRPASLGPLSVPTKPKLAPARRAATRAELTADPSVNPFAAIDAARARFDGSVAPRPATTRTPVQEVLDERRSCWDRNRPMSDRRNNISFVEEKKR